MSMKPFLIDRTSLGDIGQLGVPVEKGDVNVSMGTALYLRGIET